MICLTTRPTSCSDLGCYCKNGIETEGSSGFERVECIVGGVEEGDEEVAALEESVKMVCIMQLAGELCMSLLVEV